MSIKLEKNLKNSDAKSLNPITLAYTNQIFDGFPIIIGNLVAELQANKHKVHFQA